jgi:hypothetical protein
MHIQQNALNRKRRKNAKELHSEHIRWLSSLGEIKIEIIALLKHGNDILLKDINSLLKESLRLQKIIMKHEKKMANAFKVFGIYSYTDVFVDHEKIRHQMVSLNYKLENLKLLYIRVNSTNNINEFDNSNLHNRINC